MKISCYKSAEHTLYISLDKFSNVNIDADRLAASYIANSEVQKINFIGEPFSNVTSLFRLIRAFRNVCNDPINIYTNCYLYDILFELKVLEQYKNVKIIFS